MVSSDWTVWSDSPHTVQVTNETGVDSWNDVLNDNIVKDAKIGNS